MSNRQKPQGKRPGLQPAIVPAANYRVHRPPRAYTPTERALHLSATRVCGHRGGPYVCTLPPHPETPTHQAGADAAGIAAEWGWA